MSKISIIKLGRIVGTILISVLIILASTTLLSIWKMNDKVKELIYYSNVNQEINDLTSHVDSIMEELLNVNSSYNDSNKEKMKIANDNIGSIYAEYIENDFVNNDEIKIMNNIKEKYNTFYKKVSECINMNKILMTLSDEEYNEIYSMYSDIYEPIGELRSYMEDNSEAAIKSGRATVKNIVIIVICVNILVIGFVARLIFGVNNAVKRFVLEIEEGFENIRLGNLSHNIEVNGKSEFQEIKRNLNKTTNEFGEIISKVKDSSNEVSLTSNILKQITENQKRDSDNITLAIEEVNRGTEGQADGLMEITNTLEKFSSLIEGFVDNVNYTNETSNKIAENATESSSKMNNLKEVFALIEKSFEAYIEQIGTLGDDIKKVNDISNLINDIAEQTNMLALNAAIEAARAGEQGKGFAVVADQIRSLAEQTKDSAEHINRLIEGVSSGTIDIINRSNEMNSNLAESGQAIDGSLLSFDEIIKMISEVVPKISELRNSAEEIKSEKDNLVSNIQSASAVAEEIAASTEEITASVDSLKSSSEEVLKTSTQLNELTCVLDEHVNQFKVE